jgi:hypothetical protein
MMKLARLDCDSLPFRGCRERVHSKRQIGARQKIDLSKTPRSDFFEEGKGSGTPEILLRNVAGPFSVLSRGRA